MAAAWAQEKGVPVYFDGQPLFRLYSGTGRFSVAERATLIEARLDRIARDNRADLDSFRTDDIDNVTLVMAGDMECVAITNRDATDAGEPRRHLAARYMQSIRDSMGHFREARNSRSLLRSWIQAVALTVVLFGIIWALLLLKRRYQRWRTQWNIHHPPVSGSTSLSFDPDRSALNLIEAAATGTAVLALAYFYLYLLLSFFPGTANLSRSIARWLPLELGDFWNNFLAVLPKLGTVLLIFVVTYYLVQLLRVVFGAISTGRLKIEGFYPEWAESTYKLARFLLFLLAIAVAYPFLPGSDSLAFKGVTVFLGALLSLGSSSVVANALAGIILVYTRAFRTGDRIRIKDDMGDILERTLFVTRVRSLKNEIVTIPNSAILSGSVTNYSAEAQTQGLILHTRVTISYAVPWPQVHELLITAATDTPGILQTPAPYVLQRALNEFYVTYEINAYTNQPQAMIRTYSLLHARIQDHFNAAQVEITAPNYLAFRDGTRSTNAEMRSPEEFVSDRTGS